MRGVITKISVQVLEYACRTTWLERNFVRSTRGSQRVKERDPKQRSRNANLRITVKKRYQQFFCFEEIFEQLVNVREISLSNNILIFVQLRIVYIRIHRCDFLVALTRLPSNHPEKLLSLPFSRTLQVPDSILESSHSPREPL